MARNQLEADISERLFDEADLRSMVETFGQDFVDEFVLGRAKWQDAMTRGMADER